MKVRFLIICLFVLSAIKTKGQELEKYEARMYISGSDTIPYRILYPENFDPAKKYAVLFFLHGRGESGSDNQKQLTHGGRLFLREDVRKNFPAIVVFPQCASSSYWANVKITADSTGKRSFNFVKGGKPTKAMHALLSLVDEITEEPYVSREQIYVGGLSMGGMGTYELLRRKPKLFAAAFAICGGDNEANVKKYRKVPLWIFHGAKDDVVTPHHSEVVVKALRKRGADVKFTLYPEANHNSWDSAFAEPELLPWLFSHQKK